MKARLLLCLVASLLLIFSGHFAFAQEKVEVEELMELSLEELMEYEVAGRGEAGSFGYRLAESGAAVTLHGYVTSEYIITEGKPGTFDQHYFNVFVTGQLGEKIVAEIQLEYEHGGSEVQARYAQVDYLAFPWMIVRTGKFLIPSGPFNEFLYPEFITKTVQRPFVNREIAPTAWADVGVQLRGVIPTAGDWKPSYALYVVNGLEGDEGSGIRGMRGAGGFRDKKDNNKAVGGRLGVTFKGFETGGALYNGAYTEDGELDLTIYGFDLAYVAPRFSIRGEYQAATQEQDALGDDIDKDGFYVLASVILWDHFEPVIRYDQIDEGIDVSPEKDKQRWTLGLNYLFSNFAKVKVNYEIVTDDAPGSDKDDNTIGLQFAIGF